MTTVWFDSLALLPVVVISLPRLSLHLQLPLVHFPQFPLVPQMQLGTKVNLSSLI